MLSLRSCLLARLATFIGDGRDLGPFRVSPRSAPLSTSEALKEGREEMKTEAAFSLMDDTLHSFLLVTVHQHPNEVAVADVRCAVGDDAWPAVREIVDMVCQGVDQA